MTVVARIFIAIPERSVTDTWDRILDLIAPEPNSAARQELAAVAGVVCNCIADETFADDALVVHGAGPRLRIYALYGDEAVDGDRANESPLSWVPTDGDWRMSIPCRDDDLAWVRAKLSRTSTRVTARGLGAPVEGDDEGDDRSSTASGAVGSVVDVNAFFRR